MEVIMVVFALVIGAVFGTVVRYWMDDKYIDEINEIYAQDKAELERTMKMREKMHINTENRLQKLLLDRDRTIFEYEKARCAPDIAEMTPEEKKKVIGSKEWFNALTDVSEPVEGDDLKYGGF